MFYKSAKFNCKFDANDKKNGDADAGNTKVGSITVPLTSCLTGLESAV